MCGSKRAHIEWDAASRQWFCLLHTDVAPRAPARRKPTAPEPREPSLPALRCDKCDRALLGGAAPGVSAYCSKCRRWVVQGGVAAE
jgi:hypothetical protein